MNIPHVLRRFLFGYLILHLLMAGLFVVVLTRTTRTRLTQEAQNQMQAMALMLRRQLETLPDGIRDKGVPEHLKRIGKDTDFRFTLIDAAGVVVADSTTGTTDIGPHNDRPEITAARQSGLGFSERYSSTLETQMMYLAIPESADVSEQAAVIRIAKSADSINSSIRSLQNLIWLFALAIGALTGLLMAIFSARSMAPLNEFSVSARKIADGQYDAAPSMLGRKDEWGSLAEAFRHMQSELANREQSIIQNSAKTSVVLSSMKEGVIAIDPSGEIILANRASEKILGTSRKELIGRRLLDIIRAPELADAIEKTLGEQTFCKTEFETMTEPRKTVNARVAPTTSENETAEEGLGATIVLNDVTDLRQLETMRQDFVANVSHELKTPLASIKAYAETLRLGAIHEENTNIAFVKQIEAQADLLNQQIHDLLQIARVESGEQNWDIKSVSVNQVCRECLNQFESEAASRKIELHQDLDKGQPTAIADVEGVRTILNNLISNAIHYTPDDGRVTIGSGVKDSYVVVTVADTGIGIDPDHQKRICERFYRVDKARSRDMGGTGLGLAIVKHLVQAFDGSVELESSVGNGSTFTIYLPISK